MPLSCIKVMIVEDQPNILTLVAQLVNEQTDFKVEATCETIEEARVKIPVVKPDLVLLDIHLPDGTAFDLLDSITVDFKAIFLTAYEQHAIQAIKYGALDYIIKPIDHSELINALHKASAQVTTPTAQQFSVAKNFHRKQVATKLVLRSQDYIQAIDIDQILYCQSDSGYTTFFLADGTKIMTSKIIKEYEDILQEPVFIRTHQSYLVNFNYVHKYRKDGPLILKTGAEIPVSTRRKEAVIQYYNQL